MLAPEPQQPAGRRRDVEHEIRWRHRGAGNVQNTQLDREQQNRPGHARGCCHEREEERTQRPDRPLPRHRRTVPAHQHLLTSTRRTSRGTLAQLPGAPARSPPLRWYPPRWNATVPSCLPGGPRSRPLSRQAPSRQSTRRAPKPSAFSRLRQQHTVRTYGAGPEASPSAPKRPAISRHERSHSKETDSGHSQPGICRQVRPTRDAPSGIEQLLQSRSQEPPRAPEPACWKQSLTRQVIHG